MQQTDAMIHSIKHSENPVPLTTACIIPQVPGNQSHRQSKLVWTGSKELCSSPTGHWSITAERHLSWKGYLSRPTISWKQSCCPVSSPPFPEAPAHLVWFFCHPSFASKLTWLLKHRGCQVCLSHFISFSLSSLPKKRPKRKLKILLIFEIFLCIPFLNGKIFP